MDIRFKTYEDTGEVAYYHPYTHKLTFLEDDETIQDVVDGWEEHLSDLADDDWHDRENIL